ncbi:MAG: hypothetical protein M1818_001653 [Claussenomyces sp. TS43310]|nr:MAG: hypothetical protein M1818_001653 [Claussenomyces sp. TS43310]
MSSASATNTSNNPTSSASSATATHKVMSSQKPSHSAAYSHTYAPYESQAIPIDDDDITFNGQPLSALYEQQARRHVQICHHGGDSDLERGRARRRAER